MACRRIKQLQTGNYTHTHFSLPHSSHSLVSLLVSFLFLSFSRLAYGVNKPKEVANPLSFWKVFISEIK